MASLNEMPCAAESGLTFAAFKSVLEPSENARRQWLFLFTLPERVSYAQRVLLLAASVVFMENYSRSTTEPAAEALNLQPGETYHRASEYFSWVFLTVSYRRLTLSSKRFVFNWNLPADFIACVEPGQGHSTKLKACCSCLFSWLWKIFSFDSRNVLYIYK